MVPAAVARAAQGARARGRRRPQRQRDCRWCGRDAVV